MEADLNMVVFDWQTTPLHLASIYGHVPCVNLLLEWQANVTQRDTDGNNCLDLAIDNNRE